MSTTSSKDDSIECKQFIIKWEQNYYQPIVAPFADVGSYPMFPAEDAIQLLQCPLKVFVQGDLQKQNAKQVILTVHDVGKTYLSMVELVNHPSMAPLREHCIFVHISVPGQEPGAKEFNVEFSGYPSMENLGNGLAQVLKELKISKCIAIGEGAGADIVCRFAMNNPDLVTGLVLIHCTSTTHGIIAHIKEIFTNLRLDDGEMTHSAWNWLMAYKFGNHDMDEKQRKYMEAIKAGGINEYNLSRFLYAFSNRVDFTDQLKDRLSKIDVQLVTGGKAPHNENVQHMFGHMCHAKTGMLIAEAVNDVLAEAPEYVASALLLLCQRQGQLAGVQLPDIIQHIHRGVPN